MKFLFYKRYIIIVFLILSMLIFNVKAETLNTKLTDLEENVDSLEEEINEINSTDMLYPIGSIYMSTSTTNPGSIFGGIWEQYSSGRQLVGVGNNGTTNYSFNSSGGSSNKTLTLANMPSHSHTLTSAGSVSSTFTGTAATSSSSGGHSHTVGWKTSNSEAAGRGLTKSGSFQNRVLVNQGSTLSTTLYITSSSSGEHSHSLTSSGKVTSTFSGTAATTSSVGSGTSFSVQNPYVTVYMWKRLS